MAAYMGRASEECVTLLQHLRVGATSYALQVEVAATVGGRTLGEFTFTTEASLFLLYALL